MRSPRSLYSSFEQAGVLEALTVLLGCSTRLEGYDRNLLLPFEEALVVTKKTRRTLAYARLELGVEAEWQAGAEMPTWDNAEYHPKNREEVARHYNDAFLAAVWTSAHVRYIEQLEDGTAEPPAPNIHTVPSALSELDLTDVFARRSAQKMCPKEASAMLNVLMRCTNPGSRGWDTLLESALEESPGTRFVCVNSVIIALAGLHPHIRPSKRPTWQERARILRVVPLHLGDRDIVKKLLVKTAVATKEAIRRTLSSLVQISPATKDAMTTLKHPIAYLTSPPLAMPIVGCEVAMRAFAEAGCRLDSTHDYETCIRAAFAKAADVPDTRTAPPNPVNPDGTPCYRWDAPYLGKGTASVHAKVSLVKVASDVYATAFRANFLPFWAHAMSHRVRACRLDAVQHKAVHSINSVTRLCNMLTEEDQLRVQQAALQHVSSGIMTIEEVADHLEAGDVRGTSSNGGAKSPFDAAKALSAAGAVPMAKLLSFARVAWLCEEIIVVDLGRTTRIAQQEALMKRFHRQPQNSMELDIFAQSELEALPIHATHICACTECKRVANAHSDEPFTTPAKACSVSFNEVGVSCAMLCKSEGTSYLRCAKRSSAALRAALNYEEQMQVRRVEDKAVDLANMQSMFANQQSADSGIAARIRRDAKNAFEQRATAVACGEQPLLNVSCVGRAVRLWNEWYSICTCCGAMIRVYPNNRIKGDICCNRCDPKLLGVDIHDQKRTASNPVCRFCQRIDPQRSGARWKVVKAPRDESGHNQHLPPALRQVWYCPSHYRSWLVAAHKSLPTRVIVSHLALGAKPVFGADEYARPEDRPLIEGDPLQDSLLGDGEQPKKRRRRRKNVLLPQPAPTNANDD